MPRAKTPRIPPYRLHRPSGRGIVQYKPLFGSNPKYLPGPYGSPESLVGYEEARAQIVAHMTGRTPIVNRQRAQAGAASVAKLFADYLDHAAAYYGPKSTEYGSFRDVAGVVLPLAGSTPAAEFGPKMFLRCREAMESLGCWSRPYINRQCQRLRRAFRWGVEAELVPSSVYDSLRAVRGLQRGRSQAKETAKRKPVDWPTVAALLPWAAPMIGCMVKVQWLTGMRSDELTALRLCEIDRSRAVWLYHPGKHKNAWREQHKVIAIGPRAQRYILRYADERHVDSYIFAPRVALRESLNKRRTRGKSPSRDRFTRPRYDARSYNHALAHARAKAKRHGAVVPDWTPHQLRHSRATSLRASHGVEAARAVLGNTFEATLIYAHEDLGRAVRVMGEIG